MSYEQTVMIAHLIMAVILVAVLVLMVQFARAVRDYRSQQ